MGHAAVGPAAAARIARPRLIEIKAGRVDPGQSAGMNGMTPAHNTERYEMAAVIRSLDPAYAEAEPRLADVAEPLIWVGLVVLTLVTFVGWLLFG